MKIKKKLCDDEMDFYPAKFNIQSLKEEELSQRS